MGRKKTDAIDKTSASEIDTPKRRTVVKKNAGKAASISAEDLISAYNGEPSGRVDGDGTGDDDITIGGDTTSGANWSEPVFASAKTGKTGRKNVSVLHDVESVDSSFSAESEISAPPEGKTHDLKQHKDLLAAIVESSSDAIVGLSVNGEVLSWNKGARDLFKIDDEQAIGQKISSIISSKESLVPLAGTSSDTFEHAFTRHDGQALDLSIKIYQVEGAGDGTVYGAAIIRDITVQKQAEKELLLMSQQLVETNKQLEEYAWVAAHDLKEPLRTMGTYAKLVHDEYLDKLDEDGEQMLSIIYGSATNALARIDDTLKYSSLSKSSFNAETVNLNQVVKTVVIDLTKAITECGANIMVAKLPTVIGNRDMLAGLFQNLISNALKFRRKVSPEIRINAKVSKTQAVITVQDNGIGVDTADFEIIFGMFKRLDSSYPGTGLGLSIAKRIVDLHKGKIWLTSEPGKGTTFYVQLPTP